eukprot:1623119-Karenia_brevis.AAC.1
MSIDSHWFHQMFASFCFFSRNSKYIRKQVLFTDTIQSHPKPKLQYGCNVKVTPDSESRIKI